VACVSTTPIVALDVGTSDEAVRIVTGLGDRCRFYKIGNELFTAAGPSVVTRVRELGCDVFLDLKLHDIPNTVRGAARSAAALGARLLTVHAIGGFAMLEAAVDGAGARLGILAVTVLTSFDDASLGQAVGRPSVKASDEVVRLAEIAAGARTHGIVCSGAEAGAVRDRFGDALAVLVPGIRMSGGATHDQRRVVTPAEAALAGARYIVVGRAVTAAPDPRVAMDAVLADLESVTV
jgi:orotidine-5'-phosphate decarboxylase